MDGRDNAKCQKSKLRDMIGILELLNDNRIKRNSVISYIQKGKRCEGGEMEMQ